MIQVLRANSTRMRSETNLEELPSQAARCDGQKYWHSTTCQWGIEIIAGLPVTFFLSIIVYDILLAYVAKIGNT